MVARVAWLVIAALHVLGGAGAFALLPHGFPVLHARFWVDEVLPVVVVVIGLVGMFSAATSRLRTAASIIAALAGLHAGIAIAWIVVFPITGALVSAVAATTAALLTVSARKAGSVWPAVLGVAVGIAVARAERGVDPATHPKEAPRALGQRRVVPLPDWVHVAQRGVRLELGRVEVDVSPLLAFISRSPDRGWSLFASESPPTERGVFDVEAYDDTVRLDAETLVPNDVYSHLNAFCTVRVRGHRRLSVAFSAAPDRHIEVTYSEYPTGKPSRFAYLDSMATLHIVESSTGEKGPFHTLAEGQLAPDGVLGITLYDEDNEIATLTLADFVSQASTQPSPTGGWGITQNAIEFSLDADHPDADASMYMTLAGTSVGRGWDTVGHARGVYRDRIDVRRRR